MRRSRLSGIVVSLLALMPPVVQAQDVRGTPGSPSAVRTLPGLQLPAPTPPFGGQILPNAVDSMSAWPPQVMPPANAPNVLLILTDDVGFAAPSTFGGVIPTPTLDQVAAGAAGLSLVALAGFTWTASQFYGQLDGAFALIFRNAPRRGIVARTLRGLVTLAAAIVAFVVLIGVSVVSTTSLPVLAALEPVVKLASPALGAAAVVGFVALVYRLVPNRHVPWGAVRLPAVAVAVFEIALATLFVALAPHLVSLRVFGPFVTLFASFTWLSWSFQGLLVGAAWVSARLVSSDGDDRA